MARIKQVGVKSMGGPIRKPPLAKKKVLKLQTPGAAAAAAAGTDGVSPPPSTTAAAVAVVPGGGVRNRKKRRFRSGTVAVREIKKYTRSTGHLFPKAPFTRLVREVAQEMNSSIRFTAQGMASIHEAAEQYITEKFIKADMARRHARRRTLHIDDMKFTPFMTHIISEVVGNKLVG